jgi:hypothetical protein
MVISCRCSKPATIAALMAIFKRPSDHSAALARSGAEDGGLSDLVVSRGRPPFGGRGRRSRRSHCGQGSASSASALWRAIRQQQAAMAWARNNLVVPPTALTAHQPGGVPFAAGDFRSTQSPFEGSYAQPASGRNQRLPFHLEPATD